MSRSVRLVAAVTLLACSAIGCAVDRGSRVAHAIDPEPVATPRAGAVQQAAYEDVDAAVQAAEPDAPTPDVAELLTAPEPIDAPDAPELVPTPEGDAVADGVPSLDEVIQSVRYYFPLIEEAAANRVIASGEALSAEGAFDRKFEAFGNGQPLDFFENLWGNAKLSRDTMWGGNVGAGYKIGRGSFEPWFLERETNDGGELSLFVSAPIGRDVVIDANRAELWRSRLERNRVEPAIRARVILAVRDAAVTYWDWVAAGANLRVAEEVLDLALDRTEFLERQVELGEKKGIDLVDNQRIIVSRRAKLIDARRKLEQSAVKLSLFLRTPDGMPRVLPNETAAVDFPEVVEPGEDPDEADVATALDQRPELAELNIVARQFGIELAQARNETRPDVDGGMFFGQDVGNPTKSDNKSDFELEATLTVSVPLERRKARGKVRQLQGKLAQLRAKTRFAADKIAAEVRAARAALVAAADRVEQATEGVRLAIRMREAERTRFEAGEIDLLSLNIREQQAAEASIAEVEALRDFFVAYADYAAALGLEQ